MRIQAAVGGPWSASASAELAPTREDNGTVQMIKFHLSPPEAQCCIVNHRSLLELSFVLSTCRFSVDGVAVSTTCRGKMKNYVMNPNL